ncbi:MAG: hypothetical protein ABIQ99_07035 [Thermoflexales bacterium]
MRDRIAHLGSKHMNSSLSGPSLRAACRSVLVLAAAFGAAGSALAVNPSLVAKVEPIPSTVTHNTGTYPTYAAYQVTVTSYKPNPVAGVRFVGSVTVTGSTQTATLAGKISDAVTCIDGGPTRTFDCQIGPLPGAGASKTFTVILNAPSDGTAINLTWDIFFDESGSGGADAGLGTVTTTLAASSTKVITSFILPEGSTFGTGNGIASGSSNPSATTVKVPASGVATTARIEESDAATEPCAPNLLTPRCFKSDVSVPGSYPAGSVATFTGLVITLWRDSLTLNKGAKAEDYSVYYNDSQNALKMCSDPTFSPLGLPYTHNPCISTREIITKRRAQDLGLPAEAIGDLRVEAWAFDNGIWRF